MTGLSSILQPLSNDLSRRKPPNLSSPPLPDDVNASAGRVTREEVISTDSTVRLRTYPVPRSTLPRSLADERQSPYHHHPDPDPDSYPSTLPPHQSKHSRLSIAAIARDKTANALANLRPKTSTHSLQSSTSSSNSNHRTPAPGPYDGAVPSEEPSTVHVEKASRPGEPGISTSLGTHHPRDTQTTLVNLPTSLAEDRRRTLHRSRSSSRTLPATPASASDATLQNKMHQTSSRLLRMTDEERPFTRDFEDLFSTLMVSLPLSAHRVRFTKMEHTFTSEEAINNLGSLKFSQSNRMPDPKDPSRIVTTTTTTTFSMAKEMARSVCQRFMEARFIEPADGKPIPNFPLKSAVWHLTPKGMHVLTRFCQRNGINQRHVLDVLDSARNTMQLVILERDANTDKLSHDRATIEVIFRRFAGQEGPNLKDSTAASDSDSLQDYNNGIVGVKMARVRRILDRMVPNTFTGKTATDWLMDCCTTVDRREVYEIAEMFVQQHLVWAVVEDKVFIHQNPRNSRFQPTRNAIYGLTEKGQVIAGWKPQTTEDHTSGEDTTSVRTLMRKDNKTATPRDSNTNRLTVIVNDAALRLLFREFLRDTHCEENLAFYLEVRDFTRAYDKAERENALSKPDAIRETLAAAYGMYRIERRARDYPTDIPRSLQCLPGSWFTVRIEH